MFPFLGGVVLAWTFVSSAWTGELEWQAALILPVLGAWIALLLIGLFVFPRTVGTWGMFIAFSSPLAAVIALFRNGVTSMVAALLIGALSWLGQALIGSARPDST